MAATLVCRDCGNGFDAKRSDAQRCPACKKAQRKVYLHEYDHGKRRAICPKCGADIGNRAKLCLVCANKDRGERYRAEASPSWKGGITHVNGYVYHRVRQGVGGAAYRAEHDLVWEKAHGEPLPKGWVVHHLNGIKDDNRNENLLALPRQAHHRYPREALRPYEERIRQLEEELQQLRS